jgi:hypothetical protein
MPVMHADFSRLKRLTLVVAWLLGGPITAEAAPTFAVNSPSDVVGANPGNGVCDTDGKGTCTLRRAIIEANQFGGGARIILPALGKYTLISPGSLKITSSMTIEGAGSVATIIDGNGNVTGSRVFAISAGVIVNISGVTVSNGSPGSDFGGGIRNDGTLTLTDSTVSDNNVDGPGGGIMNSATGTLTLVHSTVSGNFTIDDGNGGGIANRGIANVLSSTIRGNSGGNGGGIFNDAGTLTLTGSTVSGNIGQSGGGIFNSGLLTLTNSTVSGNRASDDGGGIDNLVGGRITLLHSTITSNQADANLTGRGAGGGVSNNQSSSFTLLFQNTILAGNFATRRTALGLVVTAVSDCDGILVSNGNNVMGIANCTVTGDPPLIADPRLGPLQNNGGPTQTHAPLPSSPAIDAGDPAGCRDNLGAPLTTDQRGLPRGVNSDPCDIGAVEAQPAVGLVAAVLPGSRSVQVNATATAFGTLINTGPTSATSCRITPPPIVPAAFHYQATNFANQVTGQPDTPLDIPAGASQSFVVSFTPTQPFSPTDVQLAFDCTDSNPAPNTVGLNTLLLSASATPVPDIVALAATLSNDGIVNIPGATGTGVFAVATVNVGASGSITASADTGTTTLPVTLALCQTDPGSGACLAPPNSTVITTINGGATPTFGIFVTGSAAVPFDPATNRVFVRFKEAGVTRGSTSVAVRTQ